MSPWMSILFYISKPIAVIWILLPRLPCPWLLRIPCKLASVSRCYAPSHYRAFLSAIVSPVQASSCALLLCSIPLQDISLILRVRRCSTLIYALSAPALDLAIFHSHPNFHTILIVRLITLFIILEN